MRRGLGGQGPSLEEITASCQVEYPVNHYLERIQKKYGRMSEPTDAVSFTLQDVVEFCGLTGDTNGIHREDAQYPVVPGMMTFAALGKYFGGKFPFAIPGYTLTVNGFRDVSFEAFIAPEAPIHLQFRVTETREAKHGANVVCEFNIIAGTKGGLAVKGTIIFLFIKTTLYERLAKMALR